MTKKTNSGTSGGDDGVGYGRPPKSGQIKPGEVRNPWGRTGKREPVEDFFLKVAEELIPANVNGRSTSMTQEEAACRTLWKEALKGNPTALKLLFDQLSRRRPPLPPAPTPEEIAQQEAEEEQKKTLSARLVNLLEEKAQVKRRGFDWASYRSDSRPIMEDVDQTSSSGSVHEPVEKSGG